MKWFFIGFVGLFCSTTWVRGDAAADLYNQGITFLQNNQFDNAAKAFDAIISGYPTSPNIDDVRINAGFAYLRAGKYPEAIDRLSKQAADGTKPAYQATALYFTALSQFSQGQKSNNKDTFKQAATTLTTLINLPASVNKDFLEQAIYYRALAEFIREDYTASEKDLLQVIQQFPSSLIRPDYYLRLGSLYAEETNQAVTDKKTADVIRAQADKAISALDHVSTDPNALVQANEANMNKAEILFLIAQLDTASPAGYEKALEAYRKVRRKDDMIPLQLKRLDEMRQNAQKQAQAALQARATISLNSLANDPSLLIGREEGRLNDLKTGPDPIIQALIRMAECYVSMKQPDEARTILHRLAHAQLTPDQQQEVDFQTLYSYVLGGQTDQANKALDAYLSKHAGDPQADSISFQIAAKLMDRKDYAGALAQAERSLKDFPQGRYVADVIGVEAQALTRLGRIKESAEVVDNFLKKNPSSPQASTLLITRAQNETGEGNLDAALADYRKVRDNASAGPEMQAAADAGYIQTLNSMKKFDDVIAEAKAFETKYAASGSKAVPSVLLLAAMAMDQKHDPGAVAALQDIARKYPKDDTAPFALFYVVNIYQRANDAPAMIQAANALRQAFPEAYTFLVQAADAVSTALLKQKKFDDAIALYQPLTDAPKKDVAAAACNKIAGIWLAAAKDLGHWQSMPVPTRTEADKRLSAAEQAYLETLKKFPDQLDAVGDALGGLVDTAKQRRTWGLLKDADLEGYLAKLGADLTMPEMAARLELAKAGLVFITKDGAKQYPAALDRFKKVMAANPGLRLTRQETNQFGELLLAAQDYPAALKVYQDLLDTALPFDQVAHGDAYYGIGATYLAQGNVAKAKEFFLKLKALPQGGLWHPHILDADYGIALGDEQSGQPAELDEARQLYGELMKAPQGGVPLQAKAMLGYGRLLEKSGNALKPTASGPNEYAVHYYLEPNLLYGPAVSELSAEGLFGAGQAYEKAGDKANAMKQYDTLLQTYAATAPDWAAKAKAAGAKLGP